MSSRSEKAISQIHSEFNSLIAFVSDLGVSYHPENGDISLHKLLELRTSVWSIEEKFKSLCTNYDHALENQKAEYQSLVQLLDKIEEAFKLSGASDRAIITFLSVTRNIKSDGGHKTKASTMGWRAEVRNRSISQAIYSQRASYFEALLQVLKADATYNPTDESLTLSRLQKKLESLQFAAISFGILQTSLKRTHFHRSESLFHPQKGLIHTLTLVKGHIKNLGYLDLLNEKEPIADFPPDDSNDETDDAGQGGNINNQPVSSGHPSAPSVQDSEPPSVHKFPVSSARALW